MAQRTTAHHMGPEMIRSHYRMLGVNLAVSLVIMYFVMFTMIWSVGDFFNNLNMFYMAVMMAAPMGILMLLMMGMMYPNKKLNLMLYAVFALERSCSRCGPCEHSGWWAIGSSCGP